MSPLDPWPPSEVMETNWAMNPESFAREALGFTPDAHQARILTSPHSRGLLNCTRQWGRSTVVALKAVHRGLFRPESMILVVSPSKRQSREFLRKAKRFVSCLVGIPGKEETVRGSSAVSAAASQTTSSNGSLPPGSRPWSSTDMPDSTSIPPGTAACGNRLLPSRTRSIVARAAGSPTVVASRVKALRSSLPLLTISPGEGGPCAAIRVLSRWLC
jgi:hypothetical protein